MNFNEFSNLWRTETFLAGAFNDEQDFEAFLDNPCCGVGNKAFDEYADEINDYMLPTSVKFVSWEEI